MSVTWVPQGVSDVVGASLLLVDFPDDFTGQAVVTAAGTAAISTQAVDPGMYWRVERMTTVVTDQNGNLQQAPNGALLMVYKGTVAAPSAFRDGSQNPGLDVADQAQPITLRPGEQLLYQWTGLTPGTVVYCTAQYALYMRIVGA